MCTQTDNTKQQAQQSERDGAVWSSLMCSSSSNRSQTHQVESVYLNS